MNWDKKNIINICKIVAFGVILYWALENLAMLGGAIGVLFNILSPFIAGAAIAFIVNIPMTIFETKIFINRRRKNKSKKVVEKQKKVSKTKRAISITLSIGIIILIIAAAIFLVIPELVDVIAQIINLLPGLITDARDFINQMIIDYPDVEGILRNLQSNLESFNTEIIRELTSFGTKLVTSSFGLISSTINAIFNAVIAIIFAIYILVGKEKIVFHLKRILYAFCKEKTADKICEIATLSRNAFNNFITGQFTECIILGVLCAIGMLILRIPYAATIGIIVAITAFIPIVGAFIGGIIGVVLLLPISLTKAVIFLIFFIILQQIETNVIYPRVVGSSVGIPGILVLIAISVGGTLGGAIGMVVSLPITSVLYALLLASTSKRLKEKQIENI